MTDDPAFLTPGQSARARTCDVWQGSPAGVPQCVSLSQCIPGQAATIGQCGSRKISAASDQPCHNAGE